MSGVSTLPAPRVSVLLPVYRAEKTVRLAMRSVLNQSLRDFELIVIENGPDAGTRAAIRSLVDPRIVLISLDEPGIVGALNTGLARARGAYIARMDADDFAHPLRFELQARALERSPRLTLVSSLVRFRARPGTADGFGRYVAWQNGLTRHRDIALGRFIESPLVHPSIMVRREAMVAAGGYRDGDFPEDYDLWLRLLERGAAMRKLERTLLIWRDHPGRLTRNDARYFEKAFHALKIPFLARHLNRVATGRPLILWGAGQMGRRFLPLLKANGLEPRAGIDIDPRKIARGLRGLPVYLPEVLAPGGLFYPLPEPRPFVLVCVPIPQAKVRIVEALDGYSYRIGRDFLLIA